MTQRPKALLWPLFASRSATVSSLFDHLITVRYQRENCKGKTAAPLVTGNFSHKKAALRQGNRRAASQYARRRRGNVRMDLVSAARVLRERREEGSRRRRCDGSSGYVVKIRADRIRFRALPARLMTTIRPSRFPNSEKARRLRRRMRIVYQAKPDNAGEQFSIGEAGARCGAGSARSSAANGNAQWAFPPSEDCLSTAPPPRISRRTTRSSRRTTRNQPSRTRSSGAGR